jgi:peroxiredoxin
LAELHRLIVHISGVRFTIVSILALLFGAVWIIISAPGLESFTQANSLPEKGFLAPNFTLSTLDGKVITLSDLRGQVVLVNLWASWCGPCRAEMPAIQRVYEIYMDKGFRVLAINVTYQDSRAAAQAFIEGLGLTYPVLLDIDGQVSSSYQLRSLPSSFFIDAEGFIQEIVIGGPMAEALLTIRVEELLEGSN